jgi:hypothetical protein
MESLRILGGEAFHLQPGERRPQVLLDQPAVFGGDARREMRRRVFLVMAVDGLPHRGAARGGHRAGRRPCRATTIFRAFTRS